MRRREVIALLGSVAAAALRPRAARAQQDGRTRHVGVSMNLAADDPAGRERFATVVAGLREAGWVDGRNIQIDARGPRAIPSAFAHTQRNWSHSRRTSSWPRPRRP